MPHDSPPQWQPLGRLPLIAAILDGMLTDTEEHYQTLLEAKPKPHVLDDATVTRVLQVYTDQAADFWLYQDSWPAGGGIPSHRPSIRKSRDSVSSLAGCAPSMRPS